MNVDDGNLGTVSETDYDGMALRDELIGWPEDLCARSDDLGFVERDAKEK